MSTTTIADPLAVLAASLEAEIAGTTTELTQFPSGGAMLDVRRGDGRVFVLSYTPAQGYGVDEVRAADGFGTAYRFAYSDLAPAAHRLRELIVNPSDAPSNGVALTLVVVQARDLEAAKQFYESLGLVLRLEKHGTGPEHYAAEAGSAVLEIYPCRANSVAGNGRIGFEVASLEPTLHLLRQRSAKVVTEPRESRWGLRAVVEDPDGNKVELTQRR